MTATSALPALLELRLKARLARAPAPVAATGTIVLDASPAGTWTIRFRRGRATLSPGPARRGATTVVTLAPATLAAILDGIESGVDALMERRLAIRGNLALGLRLGAIIGGTARGDIHPRPRVVDALGVPTFCLEAGAGPPVLLLHGLGATSASMLPTLRALAGDHRVIAVDLPGFGESGKPVRDHHAAYQARWLVAVLDALGLPRAHLVGNSMGGRLAIETALCAPDRVDRLVLFAPAVAFLGRPFLPLARALRPELAVLLPSLPHRWLVHGLRACFAHPERLADTWYDSAIDEFRRIYATPRGRVALFSAARQIYLDAPHGEGGFWTRLRALSRPALFLWGALDPLVPVAFARHVAAAVPAATSVVFDDCGHIPQYELPDRTHALVREFLTGAAIPSVGRQVQEVREA